MSISSYIKEKLFGKEDETPGLSSKAKTFYEKSKKKGVSPLMYTRERQLGVLDRRRRKLERNMLKKTPDWRKKNMSSFMQEQRGKAYGEGASTMPQEPSTPAKRAILSSLRGERALAKGYKPKLKAELGKHLSAHRSLKAERMQRSIDINKARKIRAKAPVKAKDVTIKPSKNKITYSLDKVTSPLVNRVSGAYNRSRYALTGKYDKKKSNTP